MYARSVQPGHATIEVVSLPASISVLAGSFDHLEQDPYCPDRERAFSQYKIAFTGDDWQHRLLPARPHIQHYRDNHMMGGVLRTLAPITIDPAPVLDFAVDMFALRPDVEWHLDLHQWRMNCSPDTEVVCVPEGPHQDGHQRVGIFVMARHNIDGGVTRVSSQSGDTLFAQTLASGQGILLDDEQVWHHTSPIMSGTAGGYRDIFVACANEWQHRRYGEAFENACKAQ